MSQQSSLQACADSAPTDTLNAFWSQVVGAGRANEGLRFDWQKHLKLASTSCGFRYVRFHGLYHDDMHVYNEVEGQAVYNFQYVDTLFDAILDSEVRPFVELGFCPSLLATEKGTVFWWKANGSPPKELKKWADLVRATVSHWVQRYGIEEVRTWYFECWNEPNLGPFFRGSRSQYYALYESTVNVIKEIDGKLRVGGPSTSNFVPDSRFDGEWEDYEVQKKLAETEDLDALDWKPVWVEHFLKWCHSRSLPVDFVSCHPYPTDWALDESGEMSKRVRNLQATPSDLKLIRRIVAESPYQSAEIHLTEWSSSPSSRDHAHDYVPAAIYIVRTMLASLNLVETIAYWTFTDVFEEEGAGLEPFHGGFGLITLQGIPKPTFHAFRLLDGLGDEILERHDDDGIITRDSKTGFVSGILLHYPSELKTSPPPSSRDRRIAEDVLNMGTAVQKTLTVKRLHAGTPFKIETLAPGQRGDPVSAWKRLGSPPSLSRAAALELMDYSSNLEVAYASADEGGVLEVIKCMQPWSLTFVSQIEV